MNKTQISESEFLRSSVVTVRGRDRMWSLRGGYGGSLRKGAFRRSYRTGAYILWGLWRGENSETISFPGPARKKLSSSHRTSCFFQVAGRDSILLLQRRGLCASFGQWHLGVHACECVCVCVVGEHCLLVCFLLVKHLGSVQSGSG